MGEYFYYANHDKRLKFDIGLEATNNKFSGIGYGLGARAFCLLLTQWDDSKLKYHDTLIGSWIGDRVSCIGDYTKWNYEYSSYQTITANIIVMLYQIDGTKELIELAKIVDGFFVQLAYLIFTEQFVYILPEFERQFGKEWSKRYKQILQNGHYGRVYDLAKL